MAKLQIIIEPIDTVEAKRLVAKLIATGVPLKRIQFAGRTGTPDEISEIIKDK